MLSVTNIRNTVIDSSVVIPIDTFLPSNSFSPGHHSNGDAILFYRR